MRKVLLLLLLIISVFLLKAQPVKIDSASFFNSFRYSSISVRNINVSSAYTFSEVEVLDHRPDTFHIGFYRTFSVLKTALSLKEEDSMNKLFSKLQNKASNDKILIVINHLNIKNFSSSDTKQIERSNIKGYPGYITYSAKIYLNNDAYYVPLVKIDTGFFVKKNIENAGADLLEKMLVYTAEVAGQSINNKIFEKRHRFTKEELLNINIPYAKQEISSDTVKGIYLTFDDFLHHRLTKKEFILKLHKHDYYYVYIKQTDGSELLTRDIWGLYDGSQNYIMNYGFLFPLYKQGNAFFWNGLLLYNMKWVPVPYITPFESVAVSNIRTDPDIVRTPYLLNMTTGNQF